MKATGTPTAKLQIDPHAAHARIARSFHNFRSRESTINWLMTHENVRLEPQHGLALRDAAGLAITCLTGRLWLTMEGDRRDITLAAGEAYTIERNGLTLVSAAEPSLLNVRLQWDATYANWRPWLRRLASWFVQIGESRARRHRLSRYC